MVLDDSTNLSSAARQILRASTTISAFQKSKFFPSSVSFNFFNLLQPCSGSLGSRPRALNASRESEERQAAAELAL